jgi:hypothetical protein
MVFPLLMEQFLRCQLLGGFLGNITPIICGIIKTIILRHTKIFTATFCSLGIWPGNPTWLIVLVMYGRG